LAVVEEVAVEVEEVVEEVVEEEVACDNLIFRPS